LLANFGRILLAKSCRGTPIYGKRQIPVIRTSKSTNFDKRFVDFSYLYKLLILSKKGGSGLAV
jgi:hypothetical protein